MYIAVYFTKLSDNFLMTIQCYLTTTCLWYFAIWYSYLTLVVKNYIFKSMKSHFISLGLGVEFK